MTKINLFEAASAVRELRNEPTKSPPDTYGWSPADNSPEAGVKLRALLVEDNPNDVELVLFALRKHGFDVCSDVVQTVEEFALREQATAYHCRRSLRPTKLHGAERKQCALTSSAGAPVNRAKTPPMKTEQAV
jgi:hypothetical protein